MIIADDASTTPPRIIGEYAVRHPQLFRPILRQTNIETPIFSGCAVRRFVASTSHCAATITDRFR